MEAEVLFLRKKAKALGHAPAQGAEITAIPKPRGEAGSKGFKLTWGYGPCVAWHLRVLALMYQ